MLEKGRDRAVNKGITHGIDWICGSAEILPIPDCSIDLYTIAFGLRNITDIPKALKEAARVLKPGGQFVCLEFSKVTVSGLERLYDFYSFNVLPTLGEWVAKDRESYQYLVESIRVFPDQSTLCRLITEAGLKKVDFENFCGGISAVHTAQR
jgi:demethylmenaquinone methyltransferase/2-methoxy-6-polyprenyl-1,4-benzoquinol methylase